MKLFTYHRAPNPRRVRWFMAEKGIDDIEVVTFNLIKGEHRAPSYVEKAGLPLVPALELDDGTTIAESIAICRYLESRYPEPNLFGRGAEEVAVIEMWTRRAEVVGMVWKAMLAGFLATCLTASVVGLMPASLFGA